ncbi:MAG: hypothetical protein CBB60_005370 [Armatimonadetes bacterium Cent15-Ar3]|nr:MAG: hypothetical protein CBB60_005370 [Armatimonadetes bacterium Cent15-Ar3]
MILDIEHRLNFTYSGFISESSMELRVEPTSNQHQTVRSFYIAVGPVTKVFRFINWLGAPTHHFSITDYHKEIQVISRSVVESHPKHPGLEEILDSVEDIPTDGPILDSLMFTELVVDSEKLRQFCSSVDTSATLGGVVQQVAELVNQHMTYVAEVTTVATTSDEVLDHQSGVCQDFAHLALAMLRSLGIPCRYVSGYFHVSEPTKPSESHAWVEFFSPSFGWCGYDPTHGCLPDERHVMIAHGRDYNDAAPNRGVYVGNAAESLKVEVKTTEAEPTSPLDLRDDIGRIEVPVYAEFPQFTRSATPSDQMVAQQQQ